MGIKNIHIVLISASCLLSLLFGLWSLAHNFLILGYGSLFAAVALLIYGIQFINKAKAL